MREARVFSLRARSQTPAAALALHGTPGASERTRRPIRLAQSVHRADALRARLPATCRTPAILHRPRRPRLARARPQAAGTALLSFCWTIGSDQGAANFDRGLEADHRLRSPGG